MQLSNVGVAGIAHVEPPHRVSSLSLMQRLAPTLERLGLREDLLEDVAGITARRFWDEGVQPSDVATAAAEKVLTDTGIEREHIGLLINTSVCRDYLEPSTACIVHGNLGLSTDCENFDVSNACLAFLNGMQIAGRMIERGDIDYALVVNGESSRTITEATIERLRGASVDADTFRSEFASLTLGSGAVAMVLCRLDLLAEADQHRFLGSVTKAATEFNGLCRGNMDRMVTDTKALLIEGVKLAQRTFGAARAALGWAITELDHFIIHQVSQVHTGQFIEVLGVDPKKVHTIFPEFGNVGPASVPMVLSKIVAAGKVKPGDRVALMGIGSGLNCSMAEVVW